jgi:class 3 adenylate cyclase/esterase/lipase
VRLFERYASFARVIIFDKRGTGVSDPIEGIPTLEERMDDLRAVMDAAGAERAALFGFSEGGPMSLLFAATYPERVQALVLFGAMARATWAPDYPFAAPADDLIEAARLVGEHWGTGVYIDAFSPSVADDPEAKQIWATYETFGASPKRALFYLMLLDVDVRHVLPIIQAPTLVLHKHGDRVVSVHAGRWLASQIPGAKFVELPGMDHSWQAGEDPLPIADEVEEFLTGVRPISEPDRVLATVMFTDIVHSTQTAADLGDHRWRDVLDNHERLVRAEFARFRGNEVNTTGDGFVATFDGPARAIRCGVAITQVLKPLGIEARVGVHSGEVELRGKDVAGIGVHIASRVGSLAGASEVLVSETVKGLVAGSGITFAERGEHELKGVPDRWRLFAVTAG